MRNIFSAFLVVFSVLLMGCSGPENLPNSPDNSVEFKTYINSKLGWKMHIPDDAQLNPVSDPLHDIISNDACEILVGNLPPVQPDDDWKVSAFEQKLGGLSGRNFPGKMWTDEEGKIQIRVIENILDANALQLEGEEVDCGQFFFNALTSFAFLPETADEKLYVDDRMHFAVIVPATWRFESSGSNTVNFFAGGTGGEALFRVQYFEKSVEEIMKDKTGTPKSDTLINQRPAKVLCSTETQGEYCEYFVEYKGATFVLFDMSGKEIYKSFEVI